MVIYLEFFLVEMLYLLLIMRTKWLILLFFQWIKISSLIINITQLQTLMFQDYTQIGCCFDIITGTILIFLFIIAKYSPIILGFISNYHKDFNIIRNKLGKYFSQVTMLTTIISILNKWKYLKFKIIINIIPFILKVHLDFIM